MLLRRAGLTASAGLSCFREAFCWFLNDNTCYYADVCGTEQ